MQSKKMFRAALAALLLIVSLLFSAPAASAWGIPPALLSPEGVGSVTVKVLTSGGEEVPGGTLRAYFVASLGEDGYYTFTPAFEGCGLDLTQTEYAEDDVAQVADYIAAASPAFSVAQVGENGEAFFPELRQGMYLLAQDKAPAGYQPILPFLVPVPTFEGGKATYDVVCSPKPVDQAPDLEVPLTAEKDVLSKAGVTPPSDTPFSFILTPEKAGQPMPAGTNKVTGALTVTRMGAGTVDFGKFGFCRKDAGKTFVYRLREIRGSALYYTYDSTEFVISYHLYIDEEGALSCARDIVDTNGKEFTEIIFNNEYDKEKPPIPRTGQIWWPVFALAGAGTLLIALGVFCRRREEETP